MPNQRTWLCVHLPIIWMRLGSATPKAEELLFITLLNSSCCLRRTEAWVSEVTACFPNRKWNTGQKARHEKNVLFSFKKEKGVHTHMQHMHIHSVLPTIDSLISSNSKASSVFSWGQKMLFKTRISLFKQKTLLFRVSHTNTARVLQKWKDFQKRE